MKYFIKFIIFSFLLNILAQAGYCYVALTAFSTFSKTPVANIVVFGMNDSSLKIVKNVKKNVESIAKNTKNLLTITGLIDNFFVEEVTKTTNDETVIKNADKAESTTIDKLDNLLFIKEQKNDALVLSKAIMKINLFNSFVVCVNSYLTKLTPISIYQDIKNSMLRQNLRNSLKIFSSIKNIINIKIKKRFLLE